MCRVVRETGAEVLEKLLAPVGVGRRNKPVRCKCGTVMINRGVRAKRVQTLLGWLTFDRSLYRCPTCGKTQHPGDKDLDIVATSRSPGLRRQVARLGAKETFCEVSQDLLQLAGVKISRKDCERIAEGVGGEMEAWMAEQREELRLSEPPPLDAPKTLDTLYVELDGTGVPMVPWELAGRKGKQPDGTAKTREAKIGCVFSQTSLDENGKPRRDPGSTTFVGAIEDVYDFGPRLYAEAVRRGLFSARRVVVLGDGAEWVKNAASRLFGNARFIIDYYHAKEHVGELCRALFGHRQDRVDYYRNRWTDYVWEGNIEGIMQEAAEFLSRDANTKKDARNQINYFRKNAEYMRYDQYRQQGLFIGSGIVEAACRNVVGLRLKQSGMEWTVAGANAIIALRNTYLSNRANDFWENRAA